jgi:hypothetical protein
MRGSTGSSGSRTYSHTVDSSQSPPCRHGWPRRSVSGRPVNLGGRTAECVSGQTRTRHAGGPHRHTGAVFGENRMACGRGLGVGVVTVVLGGRGGVASGPSLRLVSRREVRRRLVVTCCGEAVGSAGPGECGDELGAATEADSVTDESTTVGTEPHSVDRLLVSPQRRHGAAVITPLLCGLICRLQGSIRQFVRFGARRRGTSVRTPRTRRRVARESRATSRRRSRAHSPESGLRSPSVSRCRAGRR